MWKTFVGAFDGAILATFALSVFFAESTGRYQAATVGIWFWGGAIAGALIGLAAHLTPKPQAAAAPSAKAGESK